MTEVEFAEVKAAAEARAARDVAAGIEGLRAAADRAPEYEVVYGQDGRTRHIWPTRAVLLGHLHRLERIHGPAPTAVGVS